MIEALRRLFRTRAGTAPTRAGDGKRVAFIDIGRAVAAVLVVYSHVDQVWMQHDHRLSSPVSRLLGEFVTKPLQIDVQGLGQPAVPFFFLASGFVVTPIAMRQGSRRFAVNRALRIYVPLVATVLLSAVALQLGLEHLVTGQLMTVSATTLLTNSLLVNYFILPQVVLVGVAWTLVVEVMFYLLLVAVLPLLRRCTWLAIAVELTVVEVAMMTHGRFGPGYSLFAYNASLLTLPLLGQIVWAAYTRRVRPWLAGLYGLVAWGLFLWSKYHHIGEIDDGYPIAVLIAVILFLVGLFAEPRLRQRRFWTALSDRSFSLYLVHGLVAFPVLSAVYGYLPLDVVVLVAFAATFGLVEVFHRLVERPSHRLARRLSRGRRVGTPPPDAPPHEPAAPAPAAVVVPG